MKPDFKTWYICFTDQDKKSHFGLVNGTKPNADLIKTIPDQGGLFELNPSFDFRFK